MTSAIGSPDARIASAYPGVPVVWFAEDVEVPDLRPTLPRPGLMMLAECLARGRHHLAAAGDVEVALRKPTGHLGEPIPGHRDLHIGVCPGRRPQKQVDRPAAGQAPGHP